METQVKRILVLRAGQLGDTIFASSIIEPLRRRYGAAVAIDWVLKAGMEDLFDGDRRLGRLFGLKHRKTHHLFNRDKRSVVAASRRRAYDLLVNLETGSGFADLVRAVRAEKKIGLPRQILPAASDGEHAVEYLRKIYHRFLPPNLAEAAEPSLVADPAAPLPGGLTHGEYLVLNPSNSHFRKKDWRSYRAWPLPRWRDTVARLAAGRDEKVVIIGGSGEEDYLGALGPLPDGVLSLVGKTGLGELKNLLAGAAALLTTDTGPAHLAAALGRPVLALFGPSDDRRTGPFPGPSSQVHIISRRLECSPCSLTPRIRQCPLNRCMTEIGPDEVLAALDRVL